MLLIILTFLSAISISGIAAYFSIVGLAAIFASTFWPVVIMGSVLEVGKLVTAAWLHVNWKNPLVSKLHKLYLCLSIIALMFITSLGIYGYLSRGHLSDELPLGNVNLQIEHTTQQIDQYNNDITHLQTRLNQLDSAVDAYIKNDKVTQSITLRNNQKSERDSIQKTMEEDNNKIKSLQSDLIDLKSKTVEVDAKLGPIKYVAALFGWKDPEVAVRMVILTLMFAFDPLAVILIISGSISYRVWREIKNKLKSDLSVNSFENTNELLHTDVLANQNNEHALFQKISDLETHHNRILNQNDEILRKKLMDLETKEADLKNQQSLINELNSKLLEKESLLLEKELNLSDITDKQKILDMLEANPQFLQDLIDVVSTYEHGKKEL